MACDPCTPWKWCPDGVGKFVDRRRRRRMCAGGDGLGKFVGRRRRRRMCAGEDDPCTGSAFGRYNQES